MGGLAILGIVAIFALFFIMNPVFADSANTGEQTSLSKDLQNNPLAQDILKKIGQTKKMIEELKQKEYEMNQAQENLEKMREMSIKQLTQDLDEWERQWERFSSRNVFNNFVSNRPDYVQGVFWDQFEFKEQKVNAGRTAMNNILMNGGTMQEATKAYHKIASAPKIELIEMNSQFNVKHNLADYAEQQVFNSTGQVHMSAATQSKLGNLYSDYKLQPNYILANSDDVSKLNSEINMDTQCADGLVLVSRVTSETFSCVDESIVKKWIHNGIKGIIVHDENLSDAISSVSNVKVNPGTNCDLGYRVIYNIESSKYQCVLESIATEMIDDNIAEVHTITEYVLGKDKQKITHDEIYEINQKILQINAEFDLKKSTLETKYDDKLKDEKLSAKQKMQEIIKDYKIGETLTKEDVTRLISEIRAISDSNTEKISSEMINELASIELELKNSILKIVKGYENNPGIDVDWNYLNETLISPILITEEKKTNPVKVSFHEHSNKIHLDDVDLVNSFGHKFDEIKSKQVLQVAADITNFDDASQNFIYMVEIKNNDNITVQPSKWVTGTLNSNQTLNVGLSWIPQETGQYVALISIGTGMNSVSQVADVEINVNPEGDVSDDNYCKDGYELLFKYSDNSPICTSPITASKLLNLGLAFS
ncbi:MAG: hypothetical protein ACW9W4_10460 [Candidatus Nitrosopumilus sp. bin_7KS]